MLYIGVIYKIVVEMYRNLWQSVSKKLKFAWANKIENSHSVLLRLLEIISPDLPFK